MNFIANFSRGDYISKLPDISDRYNVNLEEDFLVKKNYNTKSNIRRIIQIYNFTIRVIVFVDDPTKVIKDKKEKIECKDCIYDETLPEYLKLDKNKVVNILYKREGDENFYTVPDYTGRENKNTIYTKLRLGNFDTIVIAMSSNDVVKNNE